MQNKDQIAELFKETFENYEAPVRSGMWEQVASRIDTVSPPAPDSSITSHAVTGASKISGSLMSWIGGAVLVASVGTGIYFSQKESTSPVNTNSIVQITETGNPGAISNEVVASFPAEKSAIKQNSGNNSSPAEQNKVSQNNISSQHSLQTSPGSSGKVDNINSTPSHQTSSPVTTESITPDNTNTPVPAPTPAEATVSGSNNNSNNDSPHSEKETIKVVINAQPTSGKAPLQVNFTTPPSASTTEWLFGDGSETIKGNNVQHVFTEPGSYLVTLKTTDESGTSHVEMKRIEVLSDLSISATNIFTPNGDGFNDEFSVKVAEGVDIKVIIFDSAGKLVYKYTGAENSWNGKINNSVDAEAGTYFYVIFATGSNGAVNTHQGTLKLQRN